MIKMVESDTQYFIGYRYTANDDFYTERENEHVCSGLRIKVVNKADMSEEPHEYNIISSSFRFEDIYPCEFGLVFIRRRNIHRYSLGDIPKYKISLPGDIKETQTTENPRYIKLQLEGNDDKEKVYMFNLVTGEYQEEKDEESQIF